MAVSLSGRIAALPRKPRLVIVQVAASAASAAYVRQKLIFGEKIGCEVVLKTYPKTIEQVELEKEVAALSADPGNHGIIVQLPLPGGLDPFPVIEAITPAKDVDGLTATNLKNLSAGKEGHAPATPSGILALLDRYGIPIEGKRATVVGRSQLVGKPLALMLLNRGATVTICHRKTTDLAAETTRADILVVAAGSPGLIGREYVAGGQTVVDVGITVVDDGGKRKLCGDVDFEAVADVVSAITTVPGGVGPMTVLFLFENLYKACKAQV